MRILSITSTIIIIRIIISNGTLFNIHNCWRVGMHALNGLDQLAQGVDGRMRSVLFLAQVRKEPVYTCNEVSSYTFDVITDDSVRVPHVQSVHLDFIPNA